MWHISGQPVQWLLYGPTDAAIHRTQTTIHQTIHDSSSILVHLCKKQTHHLSQIFVRSRPNQNNEDGHRSRRRLTRVPSLKTERRWPISTTEEEAAYGCAVAAHDEYIKTRLDSGNIFLCSGACCRMRGSFITQLVRPRAVVSIRPACNLHISGGIVLAGSRCRHPPLCIRSPAHYDSRGNVEDDELAARLAFHKFSLSFSNNMQRSVVFFVFFLKSGNKTEMLLMFPSQLKLSVAVQETYQIYIFHIVYRKKIELRTALSTPSQY